MHKVKVKAYAKINITLEVTGTAGGFHALDSLVASVDLFDVIVLKKRKDKLSRVIMRGMGSESIPPETNNALKTAEIFSQTFHTNGADITVYKNIPMGAGLGGSSADVSGVLKGMAQLYGIDDEIAIDTLADGLGSDAKYMLHGGYMRMKGRGDLLAPTKIEKTLYLLLICPQSAVSTKGCFEEFDRQKEAFSNGENTEKCIRALEKEDGNEWGRYLTNDLFKPACAINPDVEKAFQEAQAFSPLATGMSGSGSCVFAVFETKELCEWAKSRYKGGFRTYVVKTV